MPDVTTSQQQSPAQLDPAQVQYLRQRLQSEQNLPLGLLAGLAASLVGAAVWAVITVMTGYQIGFMAIGVGLLVGFAVRAAGRGVSNIFGMVGAAFSLLGCTLGNLLAVTSIAAQQQDVAFLSAISQLDPGLIQSLMIAFFSPMDLLFYAIALYEGYRLAFRRLSTAELQRMVSGGVA